MISLSFRMLFLTGIMAAALPVLLGSTAAYGASVDNLQAQCKALESADLSGIPDAPTQVLATTAVKARKDLPAYCHLKGYIAPNVGINMALPSPWNGKLMEMGCGGHCGQLDDRSFAVSCEGALRKGYACVTSDLGHQGKVADAIWAYHNLQAKVDWGFRATHVVALASKAIVQTYYDQSARKSYFMGCSTGGRQALQEAQRFPWDFDGIVAGAPPVNLSTIYMTFAWGIRATHDSAGKPLFSTDDLRLLTAAAVAKCDMTDGVKDGVIGDPLHCPFDPAELACKAGQHQQCLSPAQVEAAKKVYAGPTTSSGIALSSGGPLPGAEYVRQFMPDLGWTEKGWLSAYVGSRGKPSSYELLATEGFRYLFFSPEPGPAWKMSDFDFDSDYKRMTLMESLYDSSNPDLRKFKAAGGKMIAYQGLADNSVLPRSTIDYYESVTRVMGGRDATEDFFRLFLLPGMGHCGGGSGAFAVDYLSYLEAWVEKGETPGELLSSHVRLDDLSTSAADVAAGEQRMTFPLDPATVDFSRPVYPYPVMTRYSGHGDPRAASSFTPQQTTGLVAGTIRSP